MPAVPCTGRPPFVLADHPSGAWQGGVYRQAPTGPWPDSSHWRWATRQSSTIHSATPRSLVLVLFGGPVLYVLAQAWALRELGDRRWRARLVAAAVLVVAGGLSWLAPPPFGSSLLVAHGSRGIPAGTPLPEPSGSR